MNDQKQQLITRLKEATNVLVTVSNNPSLDQLSGAIGLTLALNHLNKHGTAVFSGQTPPIISFLEPEKTLEKNTDSLRDFIISLDRSKADKLRYKVEDTQVKIFISPYRTSIQESDLNFSQGDLNVDLVVALGVHEQKDIDSAIASHGRILHDATVATINTTKDATAGSINWVDEQMSSLCEMLGHLIDELDEKVLDAQISTALLTGVVAETERFSNQKTAAATMSLGSRLLQAGANQQLVAEKLEPEPPQPEPEPQPPQPEDPPQPPSEPPQPEPESQQRPLEDQASEEARNQQTKADEAGVLHIQHSGNGESDSQQIHIDEHGNLQPAGGAPNAEKSSPQQPNQSSEDLSSQNAEDNQLPKIISKPQNSMLHEEDAPKQDNVFAPNTDEDDDFVNPLTAPDDKKKERILSHDDTAKAQPSSADTTVTPEATPASPPVEKADQETPSPQDESPQNPTQTLSDIEHAVGAHQGTDSAQDKQATTAEAQNPQPDMEFAPAHSDTLPTQTKPPAELDEARQAIMDAVHRPQADSQPNNNAQNSGNAASDNSSQPQQNSNQGVSNPNQPPPVPPPMMPPGQQST